MKLAHLLNKQKCIDNAWWENGVLKCQDCGREIAIRYRLNGETKVYIFQPFKAYAFDILEIKDKQDYGTSHYIGELDYQDFAGISEIKPLESLFTEEFEEITDGVAQPV